MVSEAKSDRASAGFSSFYKTRQRLYGALLLFVIVAGVPIAAVPKLRYRVMTRAQALWDAMAGKRAPTMVQVGENQEPFPAEFKRPAPPVPQVLHLPPPAKVLSTKQGGYAPRSSSKSGIIEMKSPATIQGEEAGEEVNTESAAADNEPTYQQGKMEQEAYDLLLNSNPTVAEIVKGNNSSFRFKSWDAAARGEDTYWVRLKLETGGKPEADYIWQVKLQSKQASPLNYNARTIS